MSGLCVCALHACKYFISSLHDKIINAQLLLWYMAIDIRYSS